MLENGGRLYLAKDATMSAQTFRAMYPDLPRFRQLKAEIDPHNRFSSSQARRLGIVGSRMSENVLILGATSGIAKELSRVLAERGCSLVLAGRDREELEKSAADLRLRYQARRRG